MNRSTKNRALSLLFVSAAAMASACGGDRAPSAPPVPPPARVEPKATAAPGSPGWPVEVVDSLGRKVTVARLPERIISLAPSNTEILYAVGAGDQVIGGTSFDSYPPEARKRASIGGMTPKSINLEAVMGLRPDLVLATSGVQEPIIGSLERLNLTAAALDATDFAGVARNIRTVGRLTGHTDTADRLAASFLERVAAVTRRVAARHAPRPKVLYLLGDDPLITAGPGTFIGQMIDIAGGINVFGDVTARFPRPSEEEILARAPEVILAAARPMGAAQRDDDAHRRRIQARPGWDRIPAVQQNRIIFLDEDTIVRPGPRLVDGLEAVAKILERDSP